MIRKYCYDGDRVIAEYDDNGFIKASFVYGPGIDEPIAILSTSLYYYHYDGLGSVTALSNTSGVVVERYEYDVFGKCIVHTGAGVDGEWMTGDDITDTKSALRNPYMFTGRRLDDETGLYYYRARYYSPETGRFIQPDPIRYGDGFNMYAYCKNNPINWIDPWGLDALDFGDGQLTHYGDDGSVTRYPATSGQPFRGPSEDGGPIPPGYYTLYPDEISNRGWLRRARDRWYREDWGRRRVPLHPSAGNEMFGRDEFFLHGGRSPGSGGCIDIGSNDDDLLDRLRNHHGPIPLRVREPSERECIPHEELGDFPPLEPFPGGGYA